MNAKNSARALYLLGLCAVTSCGDNSVRAGIATGIASASGGAAPAAGAAPATNGGTPGSNVPGAGGTVGAGAAPVVGGAPGPGGGSPGGMGASPGGSSAGSGGAGNGGDTAAGGTSPSGGSGNAAGTAGASTAGAAGAASFPAPVNAPLVWGFGVGITDVPAAVKFYTGVMKMAVEKDAVKRDDRTETTLYGTQAMRGARLVLMKFDDMRNTRKITAKLVWQAQNAAAVNTAAASYPDYVSRLNFGIVQFDGPETYIQEVGNVFDSGGAAITVPYPIAMGFAVSNQPASRKFYTSLGMTESSLGSFAVTDVNGAGNIAEYSVKFTDGMGVVLQQWTPARNAKDNPIKVVLMVPDAKAMADKVVQAGGMIVKQAERTAAYDNRRLVVAKDLDGTILEIVE